MSTEFLELLPCEPGEFSFPQDFALSTADCFPALFDAFFENAPPSGTMLERMSELCGGWSEPPMRNTRLTVAILCGAEDLESSYREWENEIPFQGTVVIHT
jgi:hypothetical protein